jgi:hypothetical protein
MVFVQARSYALDCCRPSRTSRSGYPKLRPWTPSSRFASEDEQDFVGQFSAAFTYVAHQGCTEEVDRRQSVEWWADQAGEWWRQRNARTNVGGAPFSRHALLPAIFLFNAVTTLQRLGCRSRDLRRLWLRLLLRLILSILLRVLAVPTTLIWAS